MNLKLSIFPSFIKEDIEKIGDFKGELVLDAVLEGMADVTL